MLLDATTRKLQIVLTEAKTANDMPVSVYYVDSSASALPVPGLSLVNSNGVTYVDILAAPAASTQRKMNALTVNNADTAAKTVQIYLDDNGTKYLLCAATLQVGDVLGCTDTRGWYVNDSAGNLKVTPTNAISALMVTNVPSGNIASTNLQDTVNEIDAEKMAIATYDTDADGLVDRAETLVFLARNSTGVTISKMATVYISGASGQNPTIALAQADAEATSSKTIGVVMAEIANNSTGYVAMRGTLHDFDTSAFIDGDTLWLSSTVAGGLTTTRPAAPNHAVLVGFVAYSHAVNGKIALNITNGSELDELHNVLITTVANNEVLQYDSASATWKNRSTLSGLTLTTLTSTGNSTVGDSATLDAHTINGKSTFNDLRIAAISALLPALTLVDHCFHLERDDSPRARGWRRRKGQSWRSETIYTGRYTGASYASATAAYSAGLTGSGTTGDIYYQTGGTTGFYAMTGVNTSTIIYRAGKEDYPTNALITAEAARVIIWDLDGAVPSMWMVFTANANNAFRGTGTSVIAVNAMLVIGNSTGVALISFSRDKCLLAYTTSYILQNESVSNRNNGGGLNAFAGYAPVIVNNTVNDVAITVLPDAPLDEYGMPVPTIYAFTAGGVSRIAHNGTVSSTATGASVTRGSIFGDYVIADRFSGVYTSIYSTSAALPTGGAGNLGAYWGSFTASSYSASQIPSRLSSGATGMQLANKAIGLLSAGLSITIPNPTTIGLSGIADITSIYNTGWMIGGIRRCFLSNSKTADRSIKAATLTEVGTVTETTYTGGRSVYSGFSAANYLQEASHADWNALGTGDFSITMSGVKWGTAATLKTILSIGNGATEGSLSVELLAANTLRLYIWTVTPTKTTICTSTATFTDTAEHVLTIKRSTVAGVANTCEIVVDGVVVASGTSAITISNATGYLRIGEGQDASQPFAGGQCSCVRISATAPTAEQSKFIAATENALNSGHACLLSNNSSVAQLDYYSRSGMLAVGNGTNTDFFNNLAREGVITTSTGATVSGTLPSEATFFHTGTTNTLRVAERNVEAELMETQISSDSAPVFKQISTDAVGVLTFPQGLKPIRIDSTAGTYVSLATSAPVFDGFLWSISGLTASTNYDCNLIRG